MFVGLRRTGDSNSDIVKFNIPNNNDTIMRQFIEDSMIKRCTCIMLRPLSVDEIKSMLLTQLNPKLLQKNPDVLSNQNISLLLERAGGSPYNVVTLISELRKALILNKFKSINDLDLGKNDVAVSRFDNLNNTEQAILKTAAVFGIKFHNIDLKGVLIRLDLLNCVALLDISLDKLVHNNLIGIDYNTDLRGTSYNINYIYYIYIYIISNIT